MEPIEREYSTNHYSSSDEIDLVDLMSTIWEGKYVIAVIVILSAIVAFVGLKLSDSYYRVDAIIDVAAPTDIRLLEPSLLQGQKANEYQVPSFNVGKVFDLVVIQLTSSQMQKRFWEQKSGEQLNLNQDDASSSLWQHFFAFRKNFSVEAKNPKAPDITSRKVTFMSTSSLEGESLLSEYLAFINKEILKNRKMDLESAYKANIAVLSIGYETLESIERQRLADNLISLKESLKIAESLGIKETPYKDLENVQLRVLDNRDYVLGSKTLEQQIELLSARQSQPLAPYSPALRDFETWKYQIELDLKRLQNIDPNTKMFTVVRSAEASLEPVEPNKLLIFVAVVIFAGFIGVCAVLLRSAFSDRKQQ